ncbi:hypothetical protein ATO10_02480 [Actibacterium atlanticum]|uniref:Uncharacterized protein n=1 Tax=Actibacterium atlanticum TaxID=1461693 RepID=A0A058ZQT1_9RHOB|nr:hypothetical protein [Actibacterium atlanticum]KCV83590.1 hypothetical protein ATO10_02480 [Actibacterium atlanticum]
MLDANKLESELGAENFALPLKPVHREAMLDLVLTWGTLDGMLAMLLAHMMGVSYSEAADTIGKKSGSGKLAEMIRLIKDRESAREFSNFLKRHKRQYERHSVLRNRIAHGHCAGYLLADDNYVIFAMFERHGDTNMAVDAVPVEEMERATKWGKALAEFIMRTIDKLDDEIP